MRRGAVSWPVGAALVVCVVASGCQALYLPGVAPQDFARDDLVYVKVRRRHTVSSAPAWGVAWRD